VCDRESEKDLLAEAERALLLDGARQRLAVRRLF